MKTDQYSSLKEKLTSKAFSSIFVLVDDNTDKFCLDIFIKKTKIGEFSKIIINSGEQNKNIDTCLKIWDSLNNYNADRKSLLINLGGGVLTDMGGFVASTYLRGIAFINIPTTLLGMVDAAHGGKTGVDFKLLKNQIGVFSEPSEVILDRDYLTTLSKDEFLNGYAEVFKHSLLTNKKELNFNSLLKLDFYKDVTFVIEKYSEIKKEIVESDRFESNQRKVLNLGHTIGHAVESYSYMTSSLNELKHGEAIIVGLITELYISHKKLNFPLEDLENIKKTFSEYFNAVTFSDKDVEQIHDLMIYDKKNEGDKVNFVLMKNIGTPVVDQQITKELFIESFRFYSKSL
ncbi:MAG: 3-dehydroquinate synthase [Cryomorphaceae bacterium]|jgi:3-dehydroquinate synthase|nr:3-dehydroquinate synthase [Cryomorphaceae bacterium]MBT4237685.1 3-dehydroquinate synthase [Cryomorphaceae bacterium]MBT4813367.1 3-dehydroquinate synthase [Cryomorphaceae bacterium]MBT6224558.1 3-dehydroquinate synthase [Cryomorphaceae bacterium]MBT6729199.1 3-dehydroquinate synthase [Cryomorphaceae bacterium]